MAQRSVWSPVPVLQPEVAQQNPVVPQQVNVDPDAAGPAQAPNVVVIC
jgi:hypothetical protein